MTVWSGSNATRVSSLALALLVLAATAACDQTQELGRGDGGPDTTDEPPADATPDGNGGACSVDEAAGTFPPYPFDYARFRTVIAPLFVSGKTTLSTTSSACVGCHAAGPTPGNGFGIPASLDDACGVRELFFQLVGRSAAPSCTADSGERVRFDDAAASKILARFVKGARDGHAGGAWFDSTFDGNYLALYNFITDAAGKVCGGDRPCNYDLPSFLQQVAPVLDQKTCGRAGCHNPDGDRLFKWAQDARDPAAQMQNLVAFKGYASLTDPASSGILQYGQGKNNHRGGQFFTEGDADYNRILAYVQDTVAACGTSIDPPALCPNGNPAPDVSVINVRAFARFLWPYVLGPTATVTTSAGCGENFCHGNAVKEANPNGLWLRDPDVFCRQYGDHPDCGKPDRDTVIHTENVRQLMCQTNVQTPLRSPILTCPLGLGPPDCPVDHSLMGGGQKFKTNEANYLAMANFVYATRGNLGVHEDIYYERLVASSFQGSFEDGNGAVRSCSQGGCHVPGAGPTFEDTRKMTNATLFLDSFVPQQSGLFLFPTNLSPVDPLVGDPDNLGDADTVEGLNVLRFGEAPHDSGGGGAVLDLKNDFDGDANQERTVNALLHFLPGLQPDPQSGAITDFLISPGTFNLAKVTDAGPLGTNDAQLKPLHFSDPRSNGDPNNVNGRPWLDFFSANADGTARVDVDIIQYLNAPVQGSAVPSRDGDTTYLFVYVYNTNPQANQTVTLALDSQQPYVLYFNGGTVLSQVGGGADQITGVPLRQGQNELLLKIQRADDQWQFQLRMLKDDGTSINADRRNVVLRLRQLPGGL